MSNKPTPFRFIVWSHHTSKILAQRRSLTIVSHRAPCGAVSSSSQRLRSGRGPKKSKIITNRAQNDLVLEMASTEPVQPGTRSVQNHFYTQFQSGAKLIARIKTQCWFLVVSIERENVSAIIGQTFLHCMRMQCVNWRRIQWRLGNTHTPGTPGRRRRWCND